MGLFNSLKRLFSQSSKSANTPIHPDDILPTEVHSSQKGSSELDSPDANPFGSKAKAFIEGTVDEVKQQGTELWESVKEGIEDIQEATQPIREKIVDTVKDVSERIEQVIETTVEKAKKMEEEEASHDKNKDGLADAPPDFGKPIEERHDDFFKKASSWVQSHENELKTTTPPETDITPSKPITPLELPKD